MFSGLVNVGASRCNSIAELKVSQLVVHVGFVCYGSAACCGVACMLVVMSVVCRRCSRCAMSSASGRSTMYFIIALVVLRITLIKAFSVAAEVTLVVSSAVWLGGVHSERFSWGSSDPIGQFCLWGGCYGSSSVVGVPVFLVLS